MWAQVWDVTRVVLLIIGALTVWALITAPVFVWVMRRMATHAPSAPPTAVDRTVHAKRATSWSQVPSWVKHDKEWAAAVVLLGSDQIGDQTMPYVDFPARQINWLGLRLAAADWPAQDRLLVEVAYDLAYGQVEDDDTPAHLRVTVADLATRLSATELDLVHEAVTLRSGR